MPRIRSFPPIEGASAHTLILGTMPGAVSLTARQYYAHPRNAFWNILGELLGFDPGIAYVERTRRLVEAGIAVWDVLQSCERRGSLDSDIERGSIVANDFQRFFAGHPGINRVFFNGAHAETLYRRQVMSMMTHESSYLRLPSTSPANASIAPSAKTEAWRVVTATSGVIYAAAR